MWSIALLGLLAVFATGTQAEVQLIIDPDVVATGVDVAVQCRISSSETTKVVSWYKKQGEKDAITVAFSTFIVDDGFKKTGRFSIVEEKNGEEVIVIMNIKGIKQEDSGDYACALNTDGERQYKRLSVIAPIEKVELIPATPYDGETGEILIKEGEQYHIMCDVTGGMPAADVKITLAGKDITARFDRMEIQTWTVNPDESISSSALGIMGYNIKMNSQEPFKVEEGAEDLYNREELVCEASVPNNEPQKDMIELVFMVSPEITCKGAFVPTGEKNVRIVCTVHADPMPHNHNVTWSWSDAFGNYSLNLGDKSENGQVQAHEFKQGLAEDEHVAELYFSRVYHHNFNTYRISAANIVGSDSAEVDLQRDEAREVESGSAGVTATLTLMGLSVMAAVFNL